LAVTDRDAVTNRENFSAWFAHYLRVLAPERNAGFLIAMVSFPLFERYLRAKSGTEPNSNKFKAELVKLIPELKTLDNAQTFWSTYRHGLLNNVTMSRLTHGLTHDSAIVDIANDGKVWLNPALFSERVLGAIEADFETFERGSPLPVVNEYGRPPDHTESDRYYLGTAAPQTTRRTK
jgi:hypothetical protein